MDGAYVKFMMCQCLLNRADWGLAVGSINVVYSIFLFFFWTMELIKSLQNYPVKWVILYGFSIMFNLITMMRIVKRESISVFYWMCGTGSLLIFRIYHLYYVQDDFFLVRCQWYRISNILLDVYIGLSLLAMLYVMCGLHLEPKRMFPKEDMVNDYKYDPQAAVHDAEHLNEKLKEKRLEMVREMELAEEREHEDSLESDCEMEELNRKALLKLADIMEEEASSLCEPTAPEYSRELCPEPTAPPESNFYLDADFHLQIEADYE